MAARPSLVDLLAAAPPPAAFVPLRGAANVARPPPDTVAFRRWFGRSKVVDKAGRPLVVFHGTIRPFEAFDPSTSGTKSKTGAPSGTFFFSSSPSVAASYANQHTYCTGDKVWREGATVLPVYLSLQRPLRVNARKDSWRDLLYRGEETDINALATYAKARRYDGLVVRNVYDSGEGIGEVADTYVAFSPIQIKSAVANVGTFDPEDPRIVA